MLQMYQCSPFINVRNKHSGDLVFQRII